MSEIKLLIIGSKSDLIQPLLEKVKDNNILIFQVNREEWDLASDLPSSEIITKIINFQPTQILYAAGVNKPLIIKNENTQNVLASLNNHISVNCISFLSIVDILQKNLKNPLIGVHVISSLYGIYGRHTRLPYVVSKHALEGVVKCLSLEYPETQIIGYRPGFFKTKLSDQNLSIDMQEKLSKRIAKKRFGLPSELSDSILLNICNPNKYLTGTFITIDGGMISGGIFEP
jgi:NAD(P)-dependent dehydrogenase (short-subunit alcohol dehydrogenase family)